jgi:hypothetical protein
MSKFIYKGPTVNGFPARFIADLLHVSESVWSAHPGVVRPYLAMRKRLLEEHAKFKGCCIATMDDGKSNITMTDRPISQWELGGRHFWNRLDKDVLEDCKAAGMPSVTITDNRVDYGKEPSIKATYALAEILLCEEIIFDAKGARVSQTSTPAHKAFQKHCGTYLDGLQKGDCFSKIVTCLTSAISQTLDGTKVDPTLLLLGLNTELASHQIETPPAPKKATVLKKAAVKKAVAKKATPKTKAGGPKRARQKVQS